MSRNSWVPPHYPSTRIQKISEKTIADVLEALVGASVISEGPSGGCKLARKFLGEEFEDNWAKYCEIWNYHITFASRQPQIGSSMLSSISAIESSIGYVFNNKVYAAQSLVHSSFSGAFECYQRLEFLGDSVVGFLACKFLYSLKPEMDPGQMTVAKSMLVCNQFLGVIALNLSLPKHMRHMNENLAQAVTLFNEDFERIQFNVVAEPKEVGDLFWNQLETCPKTIADLYESLMGAIFLDSGFDIDACWKFMNATIFEPYWGMIEPVVKNTVKWNLPKIDMPDALEKSDNIVAVKVVEDMCKNLNDVRVSCDEIQAEIQDDSDIECYDGYLDV